MNKWYGKWNILFDKWDATPYEVNVACKENDGQLSYHASFEKGKLSSQSFGVDRGPWIPDQTRNHI